MTDSFKARTTLDVGAQKYEICGLGALRAYNIDRLPFCLKILLENLLRFEDGVNVTRSDIEAIIQWDPKALPNHEIAFTPARVIMQDFTGVPCIVDLAAMREAIVRLGGDPQRVNPLAPAELSSIIRCRSMNMVPLTPCSTTPKSNSAATANATCS